MTSGKQAAGFKTWDGVTKAVASVQRCQPNDSTQASAARYRLPKLSAKVIGSIWSRCRRAKLRAIACAGVNPGIRRVVIPGAHDQRKGLVLSSVMIGLRADNASRSRSTVRRVQRRFSDWSRVQISATVMLAGGAGSSSNTRHCRYTVSVDLLIGFYPVSARRECRLNLMMAAKKSAARSLIACFSAQCNCDTRLPCRGRGSTPKPHRALR